MDTPILKQIRPHFKAMHGYSSAGMESGKSAEKIYLNANENPYPLPGLEGLNRYPEPQPQVLLDAYARVYGVNKTNIVMTRGADEAIALLIRAFCEPGQDQILVNTPTFGIYAVDAHAMPCGVISVPLKRGDGTFALDEDAIITQATHPDNKVKIVFLCSPNNPTGNAFPHDIMTRICAETAGHCVVVLDETYAEFSSFGSMSAHLGAIPNLIILRTLSKSYALAGVRMGSLLCADTAFIDLLVSKVMDIYPLPRPSIHAALHALSPDVQTIARKNIQAILAERARMEKELSKFNQIRRVCPSDANFLLIEMNDAQDFCAFAAKNNVIIRDFSNKPGTEECIRLSIGTPQENDMVLDLLKRFGA